MALRLASWTPTRITYGGEAAVVRWVFTRGLDFPDPFFDETIDRALKDPFRLLFWRETGLDALAAHAATSPGLPPAAFIFHASRCGSTLVAQMLASLPTALVLSEPPPIDGVLRSGLPDRVDHLQGMVSALGQPRHSPQTQLIVKLDAWSILDLPTVRAAFPATPCFFLYRDPVAIVASHLRRRGYHMVPGTMWPAPPDRTTAEEFCATVLAHLFEAALDRVGELTLLHYDSLPVSVAAVVAPRCGLTVDEAAFAEVAGRDAKNPDVPFTPTRPELTPDARATIMAVAGPQYDALEAIRTSEP